jgi:hypothetical protein
MKAGANCSTEQSAPRVVAELPMLIRSGGFRGDDDPSPNTPSPSARVAILLIVMAVTIATLVVLAVSLLTIGP